LILSNSFVLVIEEIGYHSHMIAEHDGRNVPNFNDIIASLEQHDIPFKDILEYYNNADDVPLVRSIYLCNFFSTRLTKFFILEIPKFPVWIKSIYFRRFC